MQTSLTTPRAHVLDEDLWIWSAEDGVHLVTAAGSDRVVLTADEARRAAARLLLLAST